MPRKTRIISSMLIVIFTLIVLEIRLYYIQIVSHHHYRKMADKQSFSVRQANFKRGTIYDRNGKELAIEFEVSSVYAIPSFISNPEETARKLAPLLHMNEKAIRKKLETSNSFVWLRRKIDTKIAEKIKGLHFKGIKFISEGKRFYPENELASQIIGLAGLDNQGLSGIENFFDRTLRRKTKKTIRRKDGFGREVIAADTAYRSEVSGCGVVTTIDRVIQYIAEVELRKAYNETKAKLATIIVQDSKTGELLALANFPSFNGNSSSPGKYKYLKNPAISNIFEPGSTFKPIVAAALLEENLVTLEDRFYCEEGVYLFNGLPIRDHEGEDWLTFIQVLEKSSNIGMAKAGQLLGKDKLYQYARDFGFGNFTGIRLPGETPGILKKSKDWSEISLSRLSFGQGIGVTAIQLISAFSCLANGGVLMEPMIVKRIVEPSGKVVKEFQPCPVRGVISYKTAKTLTNILCRIVEKGTGEKAKIMGYRVAGKTGTAQKFDPETGKYSDTNYIASFIGYLPAEQPKVTILVILDEPQGYYWGGSIAAPVFARVGLRIMHHLGIPPDSHEMFRNPPQETAYIGPPL
ncbi:MAG: penicillin-binding transpeptidase domain-containing protein [bacterium]